jgi:hypothetical protein
MSWSLEEVEVGAVTKAEVEVQVPWCFIPGTNFQQGLTHSTLGLVALIPLHVHAVMTARIHLSVHPPAHFL